MMIVYVMLFAIWYYLCNLKSVKNTHGEVSYVLLEQAIRIILKTASSDHTLMGGVGSGTNYRHWAAALPKWCWRSFCAIDPEIRWTYQATAEGDYYVLLESFKIFFTNFKARTGYVMCTCYLWWI